MRISDWSSDVCSSDLYEGRGSIFQTRQRLFAGIAKSSTSRSPTPRASPSTASKSRIPERGSRAFSHASKSRLLSLVFPPSWLKGRSEEHTSELQSLMRISYAVFCLKQKKTTHNNMTPHITPHT